MNLRSIILSVLFVVIGKCCCAQILVKDGFAYYQVKTNDTYSSIAKQYGLEVNYLIDQNNKAILKEGWVLRWSASKTKATKVLPVQRASTTPIQTSTTSTDKALKPNLFTIKQLYMRLKAEDPKDRYGIVEGKYKIRYKNGLYTIGNSDDAKGLELGEILYFQNLIYGTTPKCKCLTQLDKYVTESGSFRMKQNYEPGVDVSGFEFATEKHTNKGLKNMTNDYIVVRGYSKSRTQGAQDWQTLIEYYDISFVLAPGESTHDRDFASVPFDNKILITLETLMFMDDAQKKGFGEYQRYIGQYRIKLE